MSAEQEVREWFKECTVAHETRSQQIGDHYADECYLSYSHKPQPVLGKQAFLDMFRNDFKLVEDDKTPIETKIERVHCDAAGTSACIRSTWTFRGKFKGNTLTYAIKENGQWKVLENSYTIFPIAP